MLAVQEVRHALIQVHEELCLSHLEVQLSRIEDEGVFAGRVMDVHELQVAHLLHAQLNSLPVSMGQWMPLPPPVSYIYA